ncbi:DUF4333 domain-containing protein [Cellulomonas soli]|uniref:DUF4333 domain-containing protein n=1 Tax=Cellulomonas soli TaxID=931535 RepID=A0A512PD51_9CELL|nr:DUF4333 domain-containing protein [Cellulomonas soli]NYI58637.1 hypothetical protein [Cellulomonas soli]GEP69062.1 hypothetical protein CSO01_17770 [Cellulomonas soli]
MRHTLPTLTIALTLVVAGCAVHVDTKFVPTDELEKKADELLLQQVGSTPDSIDCPDPLPVRVDAEVRCVLTDGDQRIGLTVSVTELGEDDHHTLYVKVDDEPLPAGS